MLESSLRAAGMHFVAEFIGECNGAPCLNMNLGKHWKCVFRHVVGRDMGTSLYVIGMNTYCMVSLAI